MYDQIQGGGVKNKLLFMIFTVLGVSGVTSAASCDLTSSEYSFVVNELGKPSFNQATITDQVGTANSVGTRQGGTKLLSVTSQGGSGNRTKTEQTGSNNSTYIDQTGNPNDASIRQNPYGNTAMII